jgi:hypothetical protein
LCLSPSQPLPEECNVGELVGQRDAIRGPIDNAFHGCQAFSGFVQMGMELHRF